ncbi:MAG: hypothetical protein JXR76_02465 [Deltaproteobacteria bacterium]|nr:hypothetical protein [Deltaproteobacteria bacterium]
MFSTDEARIAPLLDVATQFVIVKRNGEGTYQRRVVSISDLELCAKVRRIVSTRADILVCGAVSWTMEAMVTASGMTLLPNTCGQLDDVIYAVFNGTLTERNFLMPGCPGRQYRNRHRRQRRQWRFRE